MGTATLGSPISDWPSGCETARIWEVASGKELLVLQGKS
jgi:hypothetical protein